MGLREKGKRGDGGRAVELCFRERREEKEGNKGNYKENKSGRVNSIEE